jgi:hypothetical protein
MAYDFDLEDTESLGDLLKRLGVAPPRHPPCLEEIKSALRRCRKKIASKTADLRTLEVHAPKKRSKERQLTTLRQTSVAISALSKGLRNLDSTRRRRLSRYLGRKLCLPSATNREATEAGQREIEALQRALSIVEYGVAETIKRTEKKRNRTTTRAEQVTFVRDIRDAILKNGGDPDKTPKHLKEIVSICIRATETKASCRVIAKMIAEARDDESSEESSDSSHGY